MRVEQRTLAIGIGALALNSVVVGLAGTPASHEALLDLTHPADDNVAEAAQRALDQQAHAAQG